MVKFLRMNRRMRLSSIKYNTFDLSDLCCPYPILQAKKLLAHYQKDDIIKLICTDPDTPKDFTDFCVKTGHHLLEHWQEKELFIFLIQKG